MELRGDRGADKEEGCLEVEVEGQVREEKEES